MKNNSKVEKNDNEPRNISSKRRLNKDLNVDTDNSKRRPSKSPRGQINKQNSGSRKNFSTQGSGSNKNVNTICVPYTTLVLFLLFLN